MTSSRTHGDDLHRIETDRLQAIFPWSRYAADAGYVEQSIYRIHGTGIFTNIYHIFMVNVGKYNIPYMDPMGMKKDMGYLLFIGDCTIQIMSGL